MRCGEMECGRAVRLRLFSFSRERGAHAEWGCGRVSRLEATREFTAKGQAAPAHRYVHEAARCPSDE